MDLTDFHIKNMKIALQHAEDALSKGEFPVGCVIVYMGEIVATGSRNNSTNTVNELDHAEINALRTLKNDFPLINTKDILVYSTMEPCLMCYSTLILNGVKQIIYGYEDVMGGGTNLELRGLKPLYSSLNVEVTPGILRNHCLALFQQFFSNPENSYWKGSLLEQYTLQQNVSE